MTHLKEPRENALHIHHLTVNYDQTPVLWDIDCSIPSGNIVGIIGPNGAGKSTLIKTALGLVQPISGKTTFFGKSLEESRRRIAYVPQRESVDWDFPITVKNLVMMGRYGTLGLFRWPKQADHAAVNHYIEAMGLTPYADRQINQLSGGQQQRAFIARALVQEADIYFMDEPFAGVDMGTEKAIMDMLHHLKSHGKTVFVVHHDLNTVETSFDWILMLNLRLIACGPVVEVFNTDTLMMTYGKTYALLDDVLKISQARSQGIKNR